jgi:hypothetical protein
MTARETVIVQLERLQIFQRQQFARHVKESQIDKFEFRDLLKVSENNQRNTKKKKTNKSINEKSQTK